jgi:hypothetical protein
MRSIKLLIAVCSILLVFEACKTSSLAVIGFWVNKDKPVLGTKRSLFIMVLSTNPSTRNIMETDLREAAKARGLNAVTSIDILGPMNVGKDFPAEAIIKKVRELNIETIFTVALKDIRTESHYVRSSETYYNPMMGGPYGAYGSFGSYYGNYWGGGMGPMGYGYGGTVMLSTGSGSSYSPGYTVEKNTIYLESNLYDTKTEELLMSVQTKAIDPESIAKASKQFTAELVKELDTEKKLRK